MNPGEWENSMEPFRQGLLLLCGVGFLVLMALIRYRRLRVKCDKMSRGTGSYSGFITRWWSLGSVLGLFWLWR